MTILDYALLGAALLAALSGWRRGFLVGVLALVGLLAGCAVGLVLSPRLVRSMSEGAGRSLAAIAIVLLGAGLGQAVASMVGMWLRKRLHWRPVRTLDSALGAVVGVLALAAGVWVLATALRSGPVPVLAGQVRSSRVIGTLDRAVPYAGRDLTSQLRTVLNDHGFPEVFRGVAEPLLPVDAPDPAVVRNPAVEHAAASVVRIVGSARSCSREIEGSGFVISPHRVLTNAHVVAGVSRPSVQVGGHGAAHDATVVLFDPARDVAVLSVPGLTAPPLLLAGTAARRGDAAVVAGFPLGGPYELDAARIVSRFTAQGSDIYGVRDVVRDVYAVRAAIRPGNSGGPLLAQDGTVLGMVFATSVDTPGTGYVLTVPEVQRDATDGVPAAGQVSTGRCA